MSHYRTQHPANFLLRLNLMLSLALAEIATNCSVVAADRMDRMAKIS